MPFTSAVLVAVIVTYAFLRLFIGWRTTTQSAPDPANCPDGTCPTSARFQHARGMLIVMGSGGHTMEMLQLLATLPSPSPYPRSYVVARGDTVSLAKIAQFELERADQDHYRVHAIPRARQVGQPYWSAVGSSLWAGLNALWLVFSDAPQLLLCNGPGTCLPLCLSVAFFKILGLLHTRQLFVESVARVQTLSLTGKIYYHLRLGDMAVQWVPLSKSYPRTKYNGMLV